MTPYQALDNLLQGRRVKLTDKYFEEIKEDWVGDTYPLKVNDFSLYQIEECGVNLYNVDIDEVIYEVPYSELLNIE